MRDSTFYLSYAVLWVIVLFQALLLLGLTRSVFLKRAGAELSSDEGEVEGLSRGTPLPAFTAHDIDGAAITNRDFGGKTAALLFVSSSCPTCSVTLEELGALQSKTDNNVVVVCRAAADDCKQLIDHYNLAVPMIAGDDAYHLSQLLKISAVPTAVLIDADGTVDSYGAPKRGEELERLFRGTVIREEAIA